jgi:membrane associated rhomboid family serine protease
MAFPIADDNSDRKSFPVVTVAIIVVNALVFLIFQGAGNNQSFTQAFSTVPKEITTGKDIVTEDGPVQHARTADGEIVEYRQPGLKPTPIPVYFTLLTSMFMHGGWMHLLGNMWFLWIFGDNIEDDLGRWWYLGFYLLCGLIAGLSHVFVNMESTIPSLGASGAISGVMGAYLVLHPQRRVTVLLFRFVTHVPAYIAVGMWFGLQVINSVTGADGGVAYAAHIGGFIAGAGFGGIYRGIRTKPPDDDSRFRLEGLRNHTTKGRDWERNW